MDGGLGTAWLAGILIAAWREVHQSHKMPIPANLLAITGLFIGLGIISEIIPQASRPILLAAWGLDVAGFLRVLPAGLSAQFAKATATEAAAQNDAGTSSAAGGAG